MLKKTLLVINSSGELLEFARRILERAGYSVECAEGIPGAREHLAGHTPDGIILDSEISDGLALDFCRELREEIGVPVLLMTGDASDELPALLAGANDFLKRTSDYSIIKARISNMLNTKSDPAGYTGAAGDSSGYTGLPEDRQPVADAAPQKVFRINLVRRPWYSVAVTALCILVVVIGMVILYTHGSGKQQVDIPANDVPLAAPLLPDENAVPYSGDAIDTIEGPDCLLPCYEHVTASAADSVIRMILLNPDRNSRFFTFEIALEEPGETLFLSGLVAPGMCINNVKSILPLDAGEINTILVIRIFDTVNLTEVTNATIAFTITVS